MRPEDIEAEADTLISDFGGRAYEIACAGSREARDRGDSGLARFFTTVAIEIAAKTGRAIEVGMATGQALNEFR